MNKNQTSHTKKLLILIRENSNCKPFYTECSRWAPEKRIDKRKTLHLKYILEQKIYIEFACIFTAIDFHIVIVVFRIKFEIASWMKMIYCVVVGLSVWFVCVCVCLKNSEATWNSRQNFTHTNTHTHIERYMHCLPTTI